MSIYKDIAQRTGGDIYIGVVGPVRTGKSTFIKKFMETSLAETIEKLKNDGYTVYAAMLDRDSVRVDAVEKGGRLAFVIGNEGHGISDEVRGACDGSVIIPMRDDGAESLNAAVAASVIMWEHKRI